MRIKQLFLTLALLCTVVQGAWAQDSWDDAVTVGRSRGDRYLSHRSRHTQVPVPATRASD